MLLHIAENRWELVVRPGSLFNGTVKVLVLVLGSSVQNGAYMQTYTVV